MTPILDPRNGDIEDDAASTKRRSLLSLMGSLLAEISLPKLAIAWMLFDRFSGPAARSGAAACLDLDRFGRSQDRQHLSPKSCRRCCCCPWWRSHGSRAGLSCGLPRTAFGR